MTATATRDLAALLLSTTLIATCTTRSELQKVYRRGCRELEWGNLEVAGELAREGSQRAREERRATWVFAFGVLDAEVLVKQRRIEEALDRLDDSFEKGGATARLRARALMTRGYARCYLPDVPEARARTDLEAAAEIAGSLGAERLLAEVILRRGTCSFEHEDFGAAEADFRKVMAMAHRLRASLIEAQAAGSLGRLRASTSRFDDAARWLHRSLELTGNRPAGGLRLKSLGNLGWCYLLLGDYERAAGVLSEAASLARQQGYAGDRVIALTNLGHAQRGRESYLAAERSYRRATAVAREIRNRDDAAELLTYTLATRAALALEQGRLDEAASQVEEALRVRVEDEDGAEWQRMRLLQGEIWARRAERSRAAARYREVLASPDAGPDLRWEAHAALARLHVRADRPDEAEVEFQQAFALMETSLSQLLEPEFQLPFFAGLRRFYNDYIDLLISRGDSLAALAVADRSRARLLRERLGGTGGAPGGEMAYPRLARDLDAVLLFYWTAPERSFLWMVHAGGIDLVTLPVQEALRQLVTTYREKILQSRDPIAERSAEGVELYETLVAPASSLLPGAARLVVVPDGPLHQLNFETLVVAGPEPHYLIEDTVVERAPSLRLLSAEEAPERTEAPSLLVLGDAVSPGDEFPPLPFAGREIDSVAALFPAENRRIYSREQAKRSAYRNADPERFTYIHFAAHAQANAVVPLESAVVLSAGDRDFKLYAREIVDIPLDAELVTLSACRSAGGRAFAGEGLVGLSWAFLSAGARHVIGGLWQVEDASTAELMKRLYRELVAGAEPAVALRRAKLELLRSGTAYRKPYYWAPFVTYASRSAEHPR